MCEEPWISVIVCDIVKVWSSCQKTTKKLPKNKPWYKDLAGYNAARADFDSEFDNQVKWSNKVFG